MWLYKRKLKHIGKDSIIGPFVYIWPMKKLKLGEKVIINAGTIIEDGTDVIIGNNTSIGYNVIIATTNHFHNNYNKLTELYDKPVKIGNHTRIGSNSKILPGVTIGDNTIVCAGSVVTNDVDTNSTVIGVPARTFLKKYSI